MKNNSRDAFKSRFDSFFKMKKMSQLVERKTKLLNHVLPSSIVEKMRTQRISQEGGEEGEHEFGDDDNIDIEQELEDDERTEMEKKEVGDKDETHHSDTDENTMNLSDRKMLVQSYEKAAIVFVRILDFEYIERVLLPSTIVKMLDTIFSDFDELIEKHGVDERFYRIKIINHIYMFSCGLPTRCRGSFLRGVNMCHRIFKMFRMKNYAERFSLERLGIVAGISGGNIVAGVVGKIPSYDCWSDCVNLASRMCTYNTTPLTVQMTWRDFKKYKVRRIRKNFVVKRERIAVKGKSVMDCVCVCRKSSRFSVTRALMGDSDVRGYRPDREDGRRRRRTSSDNVSRRRLLQRQNSKISRPSSTSPTTPEDLDNMETTSVFSDNNSGIKEFLKSLRGDEEGLKEFDLRRYGINVGDDSYLYKVEKIAEHVNKKHLKLNLYNEKTGSLVLSSILKIWCCCTCYFYNCPLNCLFLRRYFRRYTFWNQFFACIFTLSFALLTFMDMLRKYVGVDTFSEVHEYEDGTSVDFDLNNMTYFEIIYIRSAFLFLIIFGTIGIFCLCPFYKSNCVCNMCSNILFFLCFSLGTTGVVHAKITSGGNGGSYLFGQLDFFLLQMCVFSFSGVQVHTQLLFLSFNFVLQSATVIIFFEDYDACIRDILEFLFLTLAIGQALLYFHFSSIVDFYIRGQVSAQKKLIEEEESECTNLMNSILPSQVVQKILAAKYTNDEHGSNNEENEQSTFFLIENLRAQYIEEASILFADACGFTRYSSSMKPIDLVSVLDNYITEFDVLTELYGVSRIKIIGDAYMVSTVPNHQRSSPRKIAIFALKLVEKIGEIGKANETSQLRFRIGINHGSLVSGILGRTRINYDLFGRTVLIAEEYESTGREMKIHCSKAFQKCYTHHSFEKKRTILEIIQDENEEEEQEKEKVGTDEGSTSEIGKKRIGDAPYKFVERKDQVMIHGKKVVSYWLRKLDGEDEDVVPLVEQRVEEVSDEEYDERVYVRNKKKSEEMIRIISTQPEEEPEEHEEEEEEERGVRKSRDDSGGLYGELANDFKRNASDLDLELREDFGKKGSFMVFHNDDDMDDINEIDDESLGDLSPVEVTKNKERVHDDNDEEDNVIENEKYEVEEEGE